MIGNNQERSSVSRRGLLAGGAMLATGLVGGEDREMAVEKATSGYAAVDGLRVYYELHGGAPAGGKTPIVLLHGGMMAIETAFARDLLPRLAADRPVIAMEMQGHAHTADRPGPASLERMADDAVGVLSHLGVRRAHFVGHSLGGLVSLGAAIGHPERVAGLVPISANYQLEGYLPELVTMQRDPTHQPSPALIPLLPTEADFAEWQAHFQKTAPDPQAFEPVLTKLNAMLATWRGWSEAELGAIRAPTLLMIGDNDFVRVEHAAEMARLIPDAELAVLPGTTHMNIIRRGQWLAQMIEARLAGLG